MTEDNTTTEAPVSTRRARMQADAQPEGRRRRAGVGGLNLKLDAPERPGYVRRFVNDDPARIRRMQELGYAMVSDAAGDGKSRTDSLGTRISRHAGKDENGQAYQTILMETPQEEFQFGIADKEEARKPFEEAIRRQADTTGAVEGAYSPGQSTIRHSG